MDLNFNSKLDEYYQKFIELQEKLKRSEEQRFLLEMKFNEMTQVAREEEQAHYRKLRAQYKRFLEEDQKRQNRNERIIRNLERIETKISMLSAKTERISMFRRQYQNYLKRIANTDSERKIPDSRISRERSFIKKESSKEQPKLFRDDYSLPTRPKETPDKKEDSILEKQIFEHPSVKKALEKDRSNEEKIEILDRYLQSISSQRCRDILDHERQAREKLSFDTPSIDRFLNDDFPLNLTNNATAAADDIMNSIYSRYYTKAEVAPQNNQPHLQKEIPNGRREIRHKENVEKGFKPDNKSYLNSYPRKAETSGSDVSFKEGVNGLEAIDTAQNTKDGEVKKNTPGYSRDIESRPTRMTEESYYAQDQDKQNILSENGFKDRFGMYGNDKNNTEYNEVLQNNDISKNMTKYLKPDLTQDEKRIKVTDVQERENKNKHEEVKEVDQIQNVDIIKDDSSLRIRLEDNKKPYDPQTSSPQILSSKDRSQPNIVNKDALQEEDALKLSSHEQLLENNSSNPPNQNVDKLQMQNQLKHQSQEQPLEYDSTNMLNSTPESVQYYTDEQQVRVNQQNENEEHIDNPNKTSLDTLEMTQNNNSNELHQNNQDQSYVRNDQDDKHDESGQSAHYDENSQPYNQNQHDENAQPIQYTPEQYDENFAQPVQYNGNGQPLTYAENDPSYQHAQYNETGQPIQYDANNQPIQYDENGQPVQYDENGQPLGYGQYEQPLLYDQNGQIVQPQYDESGQFIPEYDENGQIIILYDQNGQQVFDGQYKSDQQTYEPNGQPIEQYDENGQPIYDQNQQPYYDYTDQEQPGQPIEFNQYQGGDQGYVNQHQLEERNGENVEGKINEIEKPTNVMDILDTDTESAKQNTISNDSDFNFS